MSESPTLADLRDRRVAAAAELADIDHAIASLEAMETSTMLDASCPHCDFVVQMDGGIEAHLRDVHPNPLIFGTAN
jgi:hypothetical protein